MNELIVLLSHPRVSPPSAVHTHKCKYWRVGKKHGPCNCGARELDARLRVALHAAGVELHESPDEVKERAALSNGDTK